MYLNAQKEIKKDVTITFRNKIYSLIKNDFVKHRKKAFK